MHVNELIKLVLIGLCIFSVIFFIFGLAKIDWDTNVDEVLKIYRNELERKSLSTTDESLCCQHILSTNEQLDPGQP